MLLQVTEQTKSEEAYHRARDYSTANLLRKLLGIKQTVVKGIRIECGALALEVRPTWRKARCSLCGNIRPLSNTLDPWRWRTVGTIADLVYKRHRPEDPLKDLKDIGVDEVSYRKGHRYLTLVSNHEAGRIAWGRVGKSAETFAAYFEDLEIERFREIGPASMDMSETHIQTSRRSRLPAFVKAGRTIRKHLEDIAVYFRVRLTNSVAEGLNNKVRLLARRAYGFHSAGAVIAMVMLCCTGIHLTPVAKSLSF